MDAGVDFNIRPEEADYFIPYGNNDIEIPDIEITEDYIDGSILPKISVVIPSAMNFTLKRNSIKHILSKLDHSDVIDEVIIVIHKDDLDVELYNGIANSYPFIRVVTCDITNNRALSRNIGAFAAKNDYLLFIDDDMIIKNWKIVDNILYRLMKFNYDVALFPRRHFLEYPSIYGNGSLESSLELWKNDPDNSKIPLLYNPIKMNSPYKTIKFCFPGCFMVISKKNFNKIGGFKEDFLGWGLEDAEFSLRAIKSLKVLNLFLKTYPLLHIDHPVSPYKSDEHKSNYKQFKEYFNAIDLDQMCNQIFTGNDFYDVDNYNVDYITPLKCIQQTFSIPLMSKAVVNRYKENIESRLSLGHTSNPEWIIIYGSRSTNNNCIKSDFDLLFLFKGGLIRDYISISNMDANIDVEFSDLDKFNDISNRPYAYPFNSSLELTKLANGILLYGEQNEFNNWIKEKLENAINKSKLIWLTTLFGMQLSRNKYGVFIKRFRNSLNDIFNKAGKAPFNPYGHIQEIKVELLKTINNSIPDWKARTLEGSKIFEIQIPEQWNALNTLMKYDK